MHIGKARLIGAFLAAALLNSVIAQGTEVRYLRHLDCTAGEIAKFDGEAWSCAADTDTNSTTACEAEQVLLGDGSCTDASALFPPVERFVDNGDGTLTDNDTGLMWEMKLAEDGMDGGNCAAEPIERDVRCVNNTYTWTDPADGDKSNPDGTAYTVHLATLNQEITGDPDSDCFAGHCDWYIPRLSELRGILLADFPCYALPCIDPAFGPTTGGYWSSTTSTDFATGSMGWWVGFGTGFIEDAAKTNVLGVRAVRRAQ